MSAVGLRSRSRNGVGGQEFLSRYLDGTRPSIRAGTVTADGKLENGVACQQSQSALGVEASDRTGNRRRTAAATAAVIRAAPRIAACRRVRRLSASTGR
jgi:hypothetical protein